MMQPAGRGGGQFRRRPERLERSIMAAALPTDTPTLAVFELGHTRRMLVIAVMVIIAAPPLVRGVRARDHAGAEGSRRHSARPPRWFSCGAKLSDVRRS